jgi:SAM-dependent methyltransferase
MDNTANSFRDKWTNNRTLAFSETLREGSDIHDWILRRNGFADRSAFRDFLSGKKRVLDAGCGNGRVTALLRECSSSERTHIVGVDLVAADVARENLADYSNIEIRSGDLLGDLSDLGHFDFIYCQEVLHHTSDPRRAFRNVCQRLAPGGEIAIYVYKQKAPAREFVDDYVRQEIASESYESAMNTCVQITRLGKALADLNVEFDAPAVPALGITGGRYDVQRFVYHFFMKCFWNPSLTFEENAAINYDWYHPQLCSRHTVEEVREWFAQEHLQVKHEHLDEYGITMRGARESESPG